MKKEEVIKEVVEMGTDITGNVGSAIVGGLIAGPLGVAIGGAGGPILTRIFKKIGSEIQNRVLSSREQIRIGAVYTFAIDKIHQNEKEGKHIRKDDFFAECNNDRSFSEEILEGIILTAQREYQELKVKYLGNLYGNICTDDSISVEHANQLIKITNLITYRQFCLLALFFKKHKDKIPGNPKIKSLQKKTNIPFDIISEIKDLYQKGLLHTVMSYSHFDAFQCDEMNITSAGIFYYETLELDKINEQEFQELNKLVNIT